MRTRAALLAAWRSLAWAPASSAAVVLALVFAVGAWHAVGAVWDSVVERELPWRDASALVSLRMNSSDEVLGNHIRTEEVEVLRERAGSFVWLGQSPAGTSRSLGDEASRAIIVGAVEPGFFEGLGATPHLGRLFRPEDHEGEGRRPPSSGGVAEGQAVALLGHDLWRSAFGSSPEVVGTAVPIDGTPMTIIGVLPPGFHTPRLISEAWVPARARGSSRAALVYGRLAPGASPAAAAEEAAALLESSGYRDPEDRILLTPLARELTASVRPTLELLRAGALLLVLAAGVSVAGLRLARTAATRRMAGIRRALGASLADDVLTTVARIGLLAGASTAGGALLAVGALPLLRRFGGDLPFAEVWTTSWASAGEAFLVAVLAASLAEAAPLVDTLRTRRRLIGSSRFGRAGGTWALPPSLLLGVAASTVIVLLTAVIGGSARDLLAGRGGYADRGLAQVTVDFQGDARGASLPHGERVRLLDELVERIEEVPEVESAAYANFLPDEYGGTLVYRASRSGGIPDPESGRSTRAVSPGLFRTLGIPLLAGRDIDASDQASTERVAVLDESYAAALGLSEPVGQLANLITSEARVVGLVANTRTFPDRSTYAAAYVPFAVPPQRARYFKAEVVARFRETPTAEQLALLGRLPGQIDPTLRATRVASVRDRRIQQLGAPLLAAAALAIFALAGGLLAVVGGVGHIADLQAREAGPTALRIALGAAPTRLVRDASAAAILATAMGVATGSLLGWILARAVAAQVAWVAADDLRFYLVPAVGLLLLMVGVALVAGRRTLPKEPWAALKTL